MKTITRDIKRAFLVSDIHFGVHSNSPEWLDIQTSYFKEFFIPLVKEHKRPGDALFVMGDVFDSRQSINILVMNNCIEIFEDLGNLFGDDGVWVMTGNHDCWTKNSSRVHSLVALSGIPNVHVFNEEVKIKSTGKNFILLPWGKTLQEEKDFLESTTSDYLFVHTDINGARFNAKAPADHGHGNDQESYRRHTKVYGGHIHYRQKVNEHITLVGCPYQMDRSDMGNKKGVYLLDFETDTETFFENDYSPEFIVANFESLLEMTREEISAVFLNKFVDLKVTRKWLEEVDIPGFVQSLKSQRDIETHEVEEDEFISLDESLEIEFSEQMSPKFDVLNLARELVELMEYDDDTKSKVGSKLTTLYEKVTAE